VKRIKSFFRRAGSCVVALLILTGLSGTLWAEKFSETLDPPEEQVWLREALNKIENRLASIEEGQKKILEGQAKHSEEHKQLRYWIHRN